jgi:hypothetical protein
MGHILVPPCGDLVFIIAYEQHGTLDEHRSRHTVRSRNTRCSCVLNLLEYKPQ